MIAVEVSIHNSWAEGARWIQAASRKVDTDELGYEERQTDADGGDKSAFVLLGSEHEDGENEFGSEEHLKEEALDNGGAAAEGGLDG